LRKLQVSLVLTLLKSFHEIIFALHSVKCDIILENFLVL
jgi:hypothetical protein